MFKFLRKFVSSFWCRAFNGEFVPEANPVWKWDSLKGVFREEASGRA